MKLTAPTIGLIAGPLSFVLILTLVHPADMSEEARRVLACTSWIALWWITEAIPIAATSLLPIVLFPLTGALDVRSTAASFGHPYIFLYAGGFIIAIAIERWNLHRRIALNIINLIGADIKSIILGFMVATAFLSMWISNTATSVMMLPIGTAIVLQLKDNPQTEENETTTFGKALMLAIAYSASIGGMATLIGTPPNLVLAGVVQETYGIEITFARWISFGLPLSVLLLVICWQYLVRFAFTFRQKEFAGGRAEIKKHLHKLGVMSYEEKLVLVVFVLTALAWITRSFLLQALIPNLDDTIIAVAGALVLFVLPARAEKRALINWEEAVQLPWGVLFLFGGGLAIAEGFQSTGLATWIGSQMSLVQGINIVLLMLVLVAAVNFLTEITSNLATTAMILPILTSMAVVLDVHPYLLLVGATVAASCAFMLPVATPPNAVVFGAGYLTIPDMVRAGIWMNVLSIILLTILSYFFLPAVWDFVPKGFPKGFGEIPARP